MSAQLSMWAAPQNNNPWVNLYKKVRENRQKLSVSIPPARDVILVRVDGRTVAIEPTEAHPVAHALLAGIEELGGKS